LSDNKPQFEPFQAKNLPIARKKFTSRSQAMTTKLDKIILEKAMEEKEEGTYLIKLRVCRTREITGRPRKDTQKVEYNKTAEKRA
jgi:hypothetical protein